MISYNEIISAYDHTFQLIKFGSLDLENSSTYFNRENIRNYTEKLSYIMSSGNRILYFNVNLF